MKKKCCLKKPASLSSQTNEDTGHAPDMRASSHKRTYWNGATLQNVSLCPKIKTCWYLYSLSLSLYMTVYILPCSNGYFSILFYFQLQFSFLSVGLLHKTDICKRLKEILSEIFFIAIIVRKPSEHIERPNRYYEDVSEYSRLSNQAWVVSNRLKNCQTIN